MSKSNAEVYQQVTDRMIAALDAGTAPWQTPWTNAGAPRSLSTRRPYRGANVFLLSLTAAERGYQSPFWGTSHQINALGGKIRKGQNQANGLGGTEIILWKSVTKRVADADRPGETKNAKILLARTFYVFNAEQTEGLPERFYAAPGSAPVADLADPQAVLDGYLADGPSLAYDGADAAWYEPETDEIHVPAVASYVSAEARYATGFHEAGHSTGHPSRLNRTGIKNIDHFGSGRYAKEELVAEMTAALLCTVTGVSTAEVFDNSAAYLNNWTRALRADSHLIVQAASQAFAAADLIQGIATEQHDAEHAEAEHVELGVAA